MISLPDALADVRENWLLYLSMPLIAAAIGYSTKLIAVKMMFEPIEFKGRKPVLGWQGIIPRAAGRMASIACDTLTSKLLDPRELFDRLDANQVAKEIEQPLTDTVEAVAAEIAARTRPEVWNALPDLARQQIVGQITRSAPNIVADVMKQIRDDLTSLFDFKELVVTNLISDKKVLNKMFRVAGRRAFDFIVHIGAPSGFLIGLLQAAAWATFRTPLIMPIFGLLTGWFTDWVALKLVFAPKQPKRILFLFSWQGVFFKHRREFTDIYGGLIAEQVVTPAKIIRGIMEGPGSDKLIAIIQRKVSAEVDRQIGVGRPLMVLAVGGTGYRQVHDIVATAVIDRLPSTMSHLETYAGDALDIQNTIVLKMRDMTDDDFEGLLRPVFKQDEWKLIAVGAMLGFAVGELQTFLVEMFAR
ncbi:MAG TPA: DUF445 domain-containing protein [Pseudonocardia sp.]|jgi:uncharacterized membrane protein YheB (UPF0754 family)